MSDVVMWLIRLVSRSPLCRFARCPIRSMTWAQSSGATSGLRFLERISPSAADLRSIESSGVTREFPDFFATTSASDSSEACGVGVRHVPSRAFALPDCCRGEPPRSPGSRASGMCERAELFDPGGNDAAASAALAASSWPSASAERVGSHEDLCFEARSPGPLTRPPTLRSRDRSRQRKDWTSRGRIPLGVGLAHRSPTSSCRSSRRSGSTITLSWRTWLSPVECLATGMEI